MDSEWHAIENIGAGATSLIDLPVTSNGHEARQLDQLANVPTKYERFIDLLDRAGCKRRDVNHWDCPSCWVDGLSVNHEDNGDHVLWHCNNNRRSCDPKTEVLAELSKLVGISLTFAEFSRDQRTHATPNTRKLAALKASNIKIRPVKWSWENRLPLGALALMAGREGIGKSILVYTLAADMTQGTLQGEFYGTPKSVLVSASEDSWEQTIVPRLMAAGADLERVYRIDSVTDKGRKVPISLPSDVDGLVELVRAIGDVALLVLDPLVSRLDAKLGTNQTKEVRQALEPLADVLDATSLTGVGLIHVNKSNTTDPLSTILGSRAFAEVPRAVLYVAKDPDDESRCLVGEPKNNLGRTDLPTLSYSIISHHVCDTDDGAITTGKLVWGESVDRDMADVLADLNESSEARSLTSECSDWLADYLEGWGVRASEDVKRDAKQAGFSESTLQRARRRINTKVRSLGFPRTSYWGSPKLTDDEFGELLESPVG